jgi:RNA-binding protein
MQLTGFQRSYLSKMAHPLSPVVMVGGAGVTDAVVDAVKAALESHELIKVKFVDHKEEKRDLASQLAEQAHAELVRVLGNMAVLYKEAYDPQNRSITLPSRK